MERRALTDSQGGLLPESRGVQFQCDNDRCNTLHADINVGASGSGTVTDKLVDRLPILNTQELNHLAEITKINLPDKKKDDVENLVYLLAVVVVFLALVNAPKWLINFAVQIIVSAIIGAITSLVAANVVEDLTGDTLKKIFLNVEIKGTYFSISLFAIATIIVKYALFHTLG